QTGVRDLRTRQTEGHQTLQLLELTQALVRDVTVEQAQHLQLPELIQLPDARISHRGPGEGDGQHPLEFVELRYPSVGHPSVRQEQDLQLSELREVRQAGVGDGRRVEVEAYEVLEDLEAC